MESPWKARGLARVGGIFALRSVFKLTQPSLDAGLTLFDVQQHASVPQSRLSLIERGLVTARPDEQERVAQALRCEVERLFPSPGRAGRQPKGRVHDDGEPARQDQLRRHLNVAAEAVRAAQAAAGY